MKGGSKPRILNVRPELKRQQREYLLNDKFRRRRVNAMSDKHRERQRRYRPIAEQFKRERPLCECCAFVEPGAVPRPTEDVHHVRGKLGELLFDTRYFKAACRRCHNWIGAFPKQARVLGLLCAIGEWNRPD
jgi:hypothetical protein